MRVIQQIRNLFLIRKAFQSLKNQRDSIKDWRRYANEKLLDKRVKYHLKKLFDLHPEVHTIEPNFNLTTVFLKEERKWWLAPTLTYKVRISCCTVVKLIMKPWKRDANKFRIFISTREVSSGQGKECFDQIKEFLKINECKDGL